MAGVVFNPGGRGAGNLHAAIPGKTSPVKVDASHLKRLSAGLGDLKASLADRVIRSSFKDAISPATQEAKAKTVHRGGFDLAKPSLGPRVKQGIKGRLTGILEAEIKSVNSWPSLARWAVNRNPVAQFRNGVTYQGLFRHGGLIKGPRYAFVRRLNNGNVHVVSGSGSGWAGTARISGVFHGPNPSHVMLHEPVSKPTVSKFYDALDKRFESKYYGALDKIKAAHGL